MDLRNEIQGTVEALAPSDYVAALRATMMMDMHTHTAPHTSGGQGDSRNKRRLNRAFPRTQQPSQQQQSDRQPTLMLGGFHVECVDMPMRDLV